MSQGQSYQGISAFVGINLSRALITMFYLALYFVPFTINFTLRYSYTQKSYLKDIGIAGFGGVLVAVYGDLLLQEGPVNTLTKAAEQYIMFGSTILLGFIGAATFFNAITIVKVIIVRFGEVRDNIPLLFSLSFLLFFVIENAAVGGDINFYERYVLQAAPYIGIVAFFIVRRLTKANIMAIVGMMVVSNLMLWRYWPNAVF